MKKIIKNKEGSALLIVVLTFFAVFAMAFGSGYLVFLSISRTTNLSNNLKAQYAARAGVERAHYEAIKENFDFSTNCTTGIFSEELGNGASYSINCSDEAGVLTFHSLGSYKKEEVVLEIDCINIEEDCSDNCRPGSLCGGGKLLKSEDSEFIVHLEDTSSSTAWDIEATTTEYGASSTDEGLANLDVLNPQINTDLKASKYCHDLTYLGYSDWYLPARDQIKPISFLFSYYNLSTDKYWSSTEVSSSSSYYFDVDIDDYEEADKSIEYFIPCIREND